MSFMAVTDGREFYLTPRGRLSAIRQKALTGAGADGYDVVQHAAARFVRSSREGCALLIVGVEDGSVYEIVGGGFGS